MKTLLLVTLIFFGCGKSFKQTTNNTLPDTMATDGTMVDTSEILPLENPTFKQTKTFQGLYISGNEISTFRDCATPKKVYWVEDESKKLASSYERAQGFLSYPFESIYVEVKGYLKGKTTTGYAGDYENVLVATEVIEAVQKSFKTHCFDYEFIGLGNEPFWSLDIIPAEKIIALKDVGAEVTYVFPYKAAKVSGNIITYEVSNDNKQRLKVIITKETCSDGMSDRSYQYSASVNINGKLLNGCAIKKGNNPATSH